MTAREFLELPGKLEIVLEAKRMRLETERDRAMKVTSTLSDMPRSGGGGAEKRPMDSLMEKVEQLEAEINCGEVELFDMRTQVFDRIGELGNEQYRKALEGKYLYYMETPRLLQHLDGGQNRITSNDYVRRILKSAEKSFDDVFRSVEVERKTV